MSDPVLRQKFVTRLSQLLEQEFTPEKLFPLIDKIHSDIAVDAAADRQRWPGQNPDLSGAIEQLKRYIRQRRAYLQSEIKRL
jgi:hypothetical protein